MERLISALPELRPELHRYCARMAGSVIDGEDIVQDALVRATEALDRGDQVRDIRPWLFRIAHNTALNHMRSQRSIARLKAQSALTVQPPPSIAIGSHTLRPFLRLPPRQRSIVLLHDLLGYSSGEISEMTDSSQSAVKSALQRGRAHLRSAADDDTAPGPVASSPEDRRWLADYTAHFNNHEFERLRTLLADDIRLEVVARERRNGRGPVGNYFTNYAAADDWHLVPGLADGQPAAIVFQRCGTGRQPAYFILLTRHGSRLAGIRDFRYANYAMADAAWQTFGQ